MKTYKLLTRRYDHQNLDVIVRHYVAWGDPNVVVTRVPDGYTFASLIAIPAREQANLGLTEVV